MCTVIRYVCAWKADGRECKQAVTNLERHCGKKGCWDLNFDYRDCRKLCDKHKNERARERKHDRDRKREHDRKHAAAA